MGSINQQPLANPLNISDQVLVWSTPNGDTRRASITALLALLQANLTPATPVTEAGTPIFLPFVGGINDVVAAASVGVDVDDYYTGQAFVLFPVSTNTGPMTIDIATLGAKPVQLNAAACTGGEFVAGAAVLIMYDGVNFQIMGTGSLVTRTGAQALTNKSYAGSTMALTGAASAASMAVTGALTGATLATTGAATVGTTLGVTGAGTIGGTLGVTGVLTPAALVDISGASAGQIKFPSSANLSADANTLDYYGEFTWTPTFTSSGGAITSYTATGIGNRIGRMAQTQFTGTVTDNGTGTGTIVVGGFPFTAHASFPSPGSGYNTSTGLSCNNHKTANTLVATFSRYDGAYPAASGQGIHGSNVYTVA